MKKKKKKKGIAVVSFTGPWIAGHDTRIHYHCWDKRTPPVRVRLWAF